MSFLPSLAGDLQSGTINVSQWEASMRDYILEQYTDALIIAAGGRENITPSDWGYLGALVKQQYQYIDGFASDIISNPLKWMSGTSLLSRMLLYQDSAYTALELFQARFMARAGFTEERNILGQADHCDGCEAETARGWVGIGQLVPIGSRECRVRCKCSTKYRKATGNGGYTYA